MREEEEGEGGEQSVGQKEWGRLGGEVEAWWEEGVEMVEEEPPLVGGGGGDGDASPALLAQVESGCSEPPIPLLKYPSHPYPA